MHSALRARLFPFSFAAAAAVSGASLYAGWQNDPLGLGFASQAEALKGALDPNDWKAFKLLRKDKVTHNTILCRFELPDNKPAGLTVASCLLTRAQINEPGADKPKMVIRPYTPTSPVDARGYMDLIVKVYPNGVMSKHIDSLNPGDTLEMKGPIIKYPYTANTKKHISMIAGGTGITPMLQVLEAILDNPEDHTQVTLVFCNQTYGDIILKGKLDGLAKRHPQQLKIVYVLDKVRYFGIRWSGGVGYLTKDMLSNWLPEPSRDHLVMVCGPNGFMDLVSGNKAKDYTQGEVTGLLKDLGFNEGMVYKF